MGQDASSRHRHTPRLRPQLQVPHQTLTPQSFVTNPQAWGGHSDIQGAQETVGHGRLIPPTHHAPPPDVVDPMHWSRFARQSPEQLKVLVAPPKHFVEHVVARTLKDKANNRKTKAKPLTIVFLVTCYLSLHHGGTLNTVQHLEHC